MGSFEKYSAWGNKIKGPVAKLLRYDKSKN